MRLMSSGPSHWDEADQIIIVHAQRGRHPALCEMYDALQDRAREDRVPAPGWRGGAQLTALPVVHE
jgi:hypothetical protein